MRRLLYLYEAMSLKLTRWKEIACPYPARNSRAYAMESKGGVMIVFVCKKTEQAGTPAFMPGALLTKTNPEKAGDLQWRLCYEAD